MTDLSIKSFITLYEECFTTDQKKEIFDSIYEKNKFVTKGEENKKIEVDTYKTFYPDTEVVQCYKCNENTIGRRNGHNSLGFHDKYNRYYCWINEKTDIDEECDNFLCGKCSFEHYRKNEDDCYYCPYHKHYDESSDRVPMKVKLVWNIK